MNVASDVCLFLLFSVFLNEVGVGLVNGRCWLFLTSQKKCCMSLLMISDFYLFFNCGSTYRMMNLSGHNTLIFLFVQYFWFSRPCMMCSEKICFIMAVFWGLFCFNLQKYAKHVGMKRNFRLLARGVARNMIKVADGSGMFLIYGSEGWPYNSLI
jgi:hypothetical protein